jgi:hypothetical protein
MLSVRAPALRRQFLVLKVEVTGFRGVFTVPLNEGIGHGRGTMSGCKQLSDAWWAERAKHFLHPLQVQIVETFQHSDQPLSVRDLTEVFDHFEAANLDHHVGRLRQLGALELVDGQSGVDFMDVRYRLARKEPNGC